ncbi:MAG: formylglycine-generating enzyme family protein [Pseudomonadota bacterium]
MSRVLLTSTFTDGPSTAADAGVVPATDPQVRGVAISLVLAAALLSMPATGRAQAEAAEARIAEGSLPAVVPTVDPRPRRLGDSLNVDNSQEWTPQLSSGSRNTRSSVLEGQIREARRALAGGDIMTPETGALDRFRAILELDPGNATAISGIADATTALAARTTKAYADGDREGAAERLSELRAIDPLHPAVERVSQLLLKDSQIGELLNAAADATEAGRLLGEGGAKVAYDAALALEADHPAALAGLAGLERLMLARAAELTRSQKFAAARELLERALSVRSDPEEKVVAQRVATDGAERVMFNDRRRQIQKLADDGEYELASQQLSQLRTLGFSEPVTALENQIKGGQLVLAYAPGSTVEDQGSADGQALLREAVVVPRGRFLMGSPENEEGRSEREGPRQPVRFILPYALAPTEVTVAEFREFVRATDYRTDAEKSGGSTVFDPAAGGVVERKRVTWEMDYRGRPAKSTLPVVHVSHNDARAYVAWLSASTGERYRLPSEAEFEYALRAGSTSTYWWGEGAPKRRQENLTGARDQLDGLRWPTAFRRYGDNHWGPAPVASFDANPFELFDMGGNVSEWVEDCYQADLSRLPKDGSAFDTDSCELRVLRGASWASQPLAARSAFRAAARPIAASCLVGFRVLREL